MAFKIIPAEGGLVKSARSSEREYQPTPFDDTVSDAVAGSTFNVGVKDVDEAKEAVSLLNKSARYFGRYLRIRYVDKDGQPVKRGSTEVKTVQFQVSDEPARKVEYTADQIREWAKGSGLPTTGGGTSGNAIPAETREAFWAAVRAERNGSGEAAGE